MGRASTSRPAIKRKPSPWPSRRIRAWTRPDQPTGIVPLLSALPSLSRPQLARLTDRLVDLLDTLDGEPDFEEPGLEDGFLPHRADGPGCPIADIDAGAWPEWDQRTPDGGEGTSTAFVTEDDEDDDPAGGAIENEGEGEPLHPDKPVYRRIRPAGRSTTPH